jgi:DNA-binding PadR family transcriptional regulator
MARRKSDADVRSLSSLELSILCLIWLRAPCTPYAVMRMIAEARSSYYKSRAGSVYTVVRRLESFGLLAPHPEHPRQIVVTPAGEAELKAWIAGPISDDDLMHTVDWVRSRLFAVQLLAPAERTRVIDDAIAGLERVLTAAQALTHKNEEIGEPYGVLATMGLVYETQARIDWLRHIRPYMDQEFAGPIAERLLGEWQSARRNGEE